MNIKQRHERRIDFDRVANEKKKEQTMIIIIIIDERTQQWAMMIRRKPKQKDVERERKIKNTLRMVHIDLHAQD